jgi:hypothetical protein
MTQGATNGSNKHDVEGQGEKREREEPHIGGIGRTKGELGWKTKGERPGHMGRIRPESKSQGGEFGDGGQQWRGHCQSQTC